MNKNKLDEYKQRLETEKNQINGRIKNLNEDQLHLGMKDTTSELSSYDNHPADLGSEMFERSKDFALRENAVNHLSAIDDALEKIDKGTYGTCSICGTTIDEERLDAIPSTTLCIDCKEEAENEQMGDVNVRPVEEDVLEPPFARTWLDHTDQNAFDGEDAWQAVAQYGNASDIPNEDGTLGEYEDPDENIGYVEEVESIPTEKELDGRIYKDFDGEDDESVGLR